MLIQQFGTPTLAENWRNMEQLVKDGLTKSIGVSNYASEDIEELSKTWTIKPAVNQVSYHPAVLSPHPAVPKMWDRPRK